MTTFVRLGDAGRELPAILSDDGRYLDISTFTPDIDSEFIGSGGLAAVKDATDSFPEVAGASSMRVGPPIQRPGKVICIGLNYRDHAEETGTESPLEPIIFMKDPMTIVGPFDPVMIPRSSTKTDWEVELGVVIGSTARYLPSPDDAEATIAGYVLSHDVSEREFQLERGGQWDKGKSCETFNPLGPYLVTADAVSGV